MLQTDDIEEDYFTPATSTTLANIFGKRADGQKTENESLTYIPPKPQNIHTKPEENKATQCVYACALYGYEWIDNAYTSKGKLGFAIVKIIKTGYHNVVLYDSSKTTLSSTTVSSNLEITVKGNLYISYFDNMQKYWSLYSTEEEIKKIIDVFKNLNVVIKYSAATDNDLPLPIKQDVVTESKLLIEAQSKIDKESDTDSSMNRRTKLSILNRMANMGHSVLPTNAMTAEKTSDSSDTNESNNYSKTVTTRHKPNKSSTKRNSADKNLEIQSLVEVHKLSRVETNVENTPPLYTFVAGQLVPVTSSNFMMSSSNTNEMNIFVSEQRINNSEMRINLNRMTDKVDQVLTKISDLTDKNTNQLPSNFQTEILQKLLNEYETKIKSYEEIIRSKNEDKFVSAIFPQDAVNMKSNNEVESLNKKLSEVSRSIEDKNNLILSLQSELEVLKEKCNTKYELETNNLKLSQENECLKQKLHNNTKENEKLEKATEKNKYALDAKSDSDHTTDIIKHILNDAFHAISANFENGETYRGEAVKSIVANVIKRAFEDLKQSDK